MTYCRVDYSIVKSFITKNLSLCLKPILVILHVREEEHTQNVPKKLSLSLKPILVILHVREEEHTQYVLTDSCCAMEGEVHK